MTENADSVFGPKTEEKVSDTAVEKQARKKKGPTIFLWSRPIARRIIVLEQKRENMTDKGAVPVAGSGKEITIEFGVYKTSDSDMVKALRAHHSYNGSKTDTSFREATEQEENILSMLNGSRIPQNELLRRMKTILSAQDPHRKVG